MRRHRSTSLVSLLILALCLLPLGAQDRLKTMPGYAQYQKMAREIPGRRQGL
jgi:hypothetical protein